MDNGAVMVTGGLGAVGSFLCRRLVAHGVRPIAVDSRHDLSRLAGVVDSCDVEIANVLEVPTMLGLVQRHRPGAIVHLASVMGRTLEAQPWTALTVNLGGTAAMLECARLSGVPRFVYVSSRMVYGRVPAEHLHPVYRPVEETQPREPETIYGKMKRASEDLIEHYAHRYGIDTAALCFGSVFGPGRTRPSAGTGSVLNVLIDSVIAGTSLPPITVSTDAKEQRDHYCYLGDYANGIHCALNASPVAGRFARYNIASEIFLNLQEAGAALERQFPGWNCPELVADPSIGLDRQGHVYRVSTRRAERELGFRAEFDFTAAVADYAFSAQALLPDARDRLPGPSY